MAHHQSAMAAILARKSLFALRSRHLALARQTLHNPNHYGMALATRSFATKQSFPTDKEDEDVVGQVFSDDEEREKLAKEISKDWSSVFERSINTLFLTEMVRGLMLTLKYFFDPKVTERPFEPSFSVNMHSDVSPLERSGALPVNSAKLFAQLKLSQLRLRSVKMEAVERPEACPVDAIVEGPNFEFATETHELSFYKIKRSCLRMETDGKLKLQRISDRRAFTVDYSDD
ncbi:unnamed protein product [Camellia sinensis]